MFAWTAAHCFDGERFLPGGATVVVDDGRILGVESREHDLPAGVPRTSYAGTMLPGLIDAHVHLVSDSSTGGLERAGTLDDENLDAVIGQSLAEHVVAGVTTVRDLGDTRYRTLHWRDLAEPGLPRIVAAGPPLTVPEGHCHYLGGAVEGPGGVRAAVAEHVERGVDVVKVMGTGGMLTPGTDINATQFSLESLRLAVDLAHEAGLRVTTHAHGLAGQWLALAAGSDGIEHFSCLTHEGFQCPDELLDAVAEAGVTICPTLGFDESRFPPPDQMPPALRDLVDRLGLSPQRSRALRAEQLRRAHARGIRIVTGVDGGAAPPKPHGIAATALLWLLDTGMPVADALATATSVAAQECGLGAVTGRLAPGLDADVLVVDGDVASDPVALQRPAAVLVRGVEVATAPH